MPPTPDSAGVRFLDAFRRGDWRGAVALTADDVQVTLPQFGLVLDGQPALTDALYTAQERFPDLVYQAQARHTAAALVLDEGFVRGSYTGGPTPTGLRMETTVRVRVEHDDTAVRRVVLNVDTTPVLRAFGEAVDATALAFSAAQAIRADLNRGLEVQSMTAPAVRVPAQRGVPAQRPPRQRSRALAAVILSLLLVDGVGASYLVVTNHDRDVFAETP